MKAVVGVAKVGIRHETEPSAFNKRELKRERGRHQIRRTFDIFVKQQELQELQLRWTFVPTTINHFGL